MTPPPRWPFTTPADAIDALTTGTFWPRLRRWAEHMEGWLDTERPALGADRQEDQAA